MLLALWEWDDDAGVCVEKRAELLVRAAAGVSALPLTSWGGCFGGALCLRDEGRAGGGVGSRFPVTLDDTRLFLSGLRRENRTDSSDKVKEKTKVQVKV